MHAPLAPHTSSPAELKELIEAERSGRPFLAYRDGTGRRRLLLLEPGQAILIGRAPESDVCIGWDRRVSRLHAEIAAVGPHWTVADHGLSRNGTRVNGETLRGLLRLRHRDQLLVGDTLIVFLDPVRDDMSGTLTDAATQRLPSLSPAQTRVLRALCRPFEAGPSLAAPATNEEIAHELHLSVAAVKTHLRILFQRFELGDLPQNEKRIALARTALEAGLAPPSR